MTVYGVIKLCVFLVTINYFIYHTNAAITSEEAKTLNFKMELMNAGFDSKLLKALMDIEHLRITKTCACMEKDQTVTENIVEEPYHKTTTKMGVSDTQTMYQDDVARLYQGLGNEKKARKSFETKTERFVQNNSKTQQDEIKQLKNIVVEMNNTIEWIKKSIPICSDPEPINNGNVDYSARIMGSFATYVCDDNYTIQGQNERKCLSTRIWDGETPVCVPECPESASLNYGTVHYDGRRAGSVVRYMCDDGYSIVGQNERKCLSTGKWDGEMAVCIKDVPMPKPSCELKITKDGHVIDDGEVAFAVGGKENLVYCDATCTGIGMPPALRWYRYRKDGSRKRLSKFNSTRVYTNRMTFNRISILTISNMLARDTGKYTCRGWLTPQGWVEKAIHLRYSCGRSSFMCDGTLCVNNDRHCDGVSDCRDGTDESTCDICAENEFVCDGRCLSMSFMCDNIPDCDDAADEQNCPSTPNTVTSTTTPTTSNTASTTDDYDYNYE